MNGYLPEGHRTILNLSNDPLVVYGSLAVWLGFMIWLGFAEGQPGENRYGEPPLAPLPVQ
ncbi:hypothetical protein [Caulobacter sp. LARHSG274]